MLRTVALAAPSVLTTTRIALARMTKSEKLSGRERPLQDRLPAPSDVIEVSSAFSTLQGPLAPAQHIEPKALLQEILQSAAKEQRVFLFGEDAAELIDVVTGHRATGKFFETINIAYEGRMLQERQVEVENYVKKRRLHYDQRLKSETEEFQSEQDEIHAQIQRLEIEKYRRDLLNDVAQFTEAREAEYQVHLDEDVAKYNTALRSYVSSAKKEKSEDAERVTKTELSMDVQKVIEEMQVEDVISNFGGATGSPNDISDDVIRCYVAQRICVYEKWTQDEVDSFTHKRKTFYEELMEARALRHAAKVRSDTEKFHKERQVYYENLLASDGEWMTHCFQQHYNHCFLQLYSHKAWMEHRRYRAMQLVDVKLAKRPTKYPAMADPSVISAATLDKELPLCHILDIYESENVTEVTKDVFLKAARRVADERKSMLADNPYPE